MDVDCEIIPWGEIASMIGVIMYRTPNLTHFLVYVPDLPHINPPVKSSISTLSYIIQPLVNAIQNVCTDVYHDYSTLESLPHQALLVEIWWILDSMLGY